MIGRRRPVDVAVSVLASLTGVVGLVLVGAVAAAAYGLSTEKTDLLKGSVIALFTIVPVFVVLGAACGVTAIVALVTRRGGRSGRRLTPSMTHRVDS